MKNTKTKLKNTLEGFNSRLDETEERIGNLEDRAVEIHTNRAAKEKKNFKKLR